MHSPTVLCSDCGQPAKDHPCPPENLAQRIAEIKQLMDAMERTLGLTTTSPAPEHDCPLGLADGRSGLELVTKENAGQHIDWEPFTYCPDCGRKIPHEAPPAEIEPEPRPGEPCPCCADTDHPGKNRADSDVPCWMCDGTLKF